MALPTISPKIRDYIYWTLLSGVIFALLLLQPATPQWKKLAPSVNGDLCEWKRIEGGATSDRILYTVVCRKSEK